MSESQLQAKCYQWFHNEFPKYRGLLCYNLNNSKNKIDGNRNKSMGLIAGRSDMSFYAPNGKAMMIEFKTPEGKQSDKQKAWQDVITSFGYTYILIWQFDAFTAIIRAYLNGWELSEQGAGWRVVR